jgi:ribosome-associated heat shock protein Hsp15
MLKRRANFATGNMHLAVNSLQHFSLNLAMSRRAQANTKAQPADEAEVVRLDKWLFAARLFKTRALAATAIDAGKVKRNGERLKTSHIVKLGECYVVSKEGFIWDFEVTFITHLRGNGAAAARMYTETSRSVAEREVEMLKRKAAFSAGGSFNHRPTKRDRRDLVHYFNAQPRDD